MEPRATQGPTELPRAYRACLTASFSTQKRITRYTVALAKKQSGSSASTTVSTSNASGQTRLRTRKCPPSSALLLTDINCYGGPRRPDEGLRLFSCCARAASRCSGPSYRRSTESLPENPGLHRLGQRHDMPRLLAACEVLVCSSPFREGFSNAIAEGMAAGLPVVGTDAGMHGGSSVKPALSRPPRIQVCSLRPFA